MRFLLICLLPGTILIGLGLALVAARVDQLAGALLVAGMLALSIGVKIQRDYWRARVRARGSHDARAAARRRAL